MKVPLAYNLHTMWERYLHYIVPQPLSPIAKKAMREYIGYYGKIADAVIGPSARVQDFLDRCGLHREIHVVPNAVELELFSRERAAVQRVAALKARYGLCPEDLVLCFCGRLGQEKSIDVLLDMFAAHSQSGDRIRLMVIGDGPMSEALRKQANTASRSEVNSISMLEAMAMGLPVIHIVDEENPGQVQEGINGLSFLHCGRISPDPPALQKQPRRPPGALDLHGGVRPLYRAGGSGPACGGGLFKALGHDQVNTLTRSKQGGCRTTRSFFG